MVRKSQFRRKNEEGCGGGPLAGGFRDLIHSSGSAPEDGDQCRPSRHDRGTLAPSLHLSLRGNLSGSAFTVSPTLPPRRSGRCHTNRGFRMVARKLSDVTPLQTDSHPARANHPIERQPHRLAAVLFPRVPSLGFLMHTLSANCDTKRPK